MNNLREMNHELKSLLPQTFIYTQKKKKKVEECNVSNKLEVEQHYYVDMPHKLIEVDDKVEEINIEIILNTKGEDRAID
jgi:hypothetical protein